MSFTNRDEIIASAKQLIGYSKTAALANVVATGFHSPFAVAGAPGAGTLAAGNTANGIVPVDTDAGYPLINAFGSGAHQGAITKIDYGSSVACRLFLYDRLFVAGAYAFNANQALGTQPDFSGRVPGTDYKGLEIWVEGVTDTTGNLAVNVSYENENGSGGGTRTTGATGIGSVVRAGRCFQLPLQAGDRGVSKILNVTGTVATVGTFNVMVLRPLWSGRVRIANDGDVHDWARTGMPRVYDNSALYMLIAPDATAIGIPNVNIQIGNTL